MTKFTYRVYLCLLLVFPILIAPAWAANTHGLGSNIREMMARDGDAHNAFIVSGCAPAVPSSSLTISSFTCKAYVKDSTTGELIYVSETAAITIADATPTWLAVCKDRSSSVSGWTRQTATHYVYKQAGTQPASPNACLVFASATVADNDITAINSSIASTSPVFASPVGGTQRVACDGVILTDGATTGASTTVTSATAAWVAGDVGKIISIENAMYGGNSLTTTIASINSPTSIEVGTAPEETQTGVRIVYGTDYKSTIQTALDDASTNSQDVQINGVCVVDNNGGAITMSANSTLWCRSWADEIHSVDSTALTSTTTGTHNGAGNSATLIDTTANFTSLGVAAGSVVINSTDGSRAHVSSVTTTTNPNDTLNFNGRGIIGGTDNDFDASDAYTIYVPGYATALFTVTDVSNVTVRGCKLSSPGTFTEFTDPFAIAIALSISTSANHSNIRILDNHITGFYSKSLNSSLSAGVVAGIHMHRNFINYIGGNGIGPQQGVRSTFIANHLENIGTRAGEWCMYFSGAGSSRNTRVIGNICREGRGGIKFNDGTTAEDGVVIIGNEVDVPDSSEGIVLGNLDRAVISGNTVKTSADVSGIVVEAECNYCVIADNSIDRNGNGTQQTNAGIFIKGGTPSNHLTIRGNHIFDSNASPDDGFTGILVTDCNDCIITDNTCELPSTSNANAACIEVDAAVLGDVDRLIISNNLAEIADASNGYGVRIQGNTRYVNMHGNLVYDGSDAFVIQETAADVWAHDNWARDTNLFIASATGNNTLEDNRLSGTGSLLSGSLGANTVFRNNYLRDDSEAIPQLNTPDTTPTVLGSNKWRANGSSTITDFDDGYEGQQITIFCESNTTMVLTDGTPIFLNGSGNFTCGADDTIVLEQRNSLWYETSRSVN